MSRSKCGACFTLVPGSFLSPSQTKLSHEAATKREEKLVVTAFKLKHFCEEQKKKEHGRHDFVTLKR